MINISSIPNYLRQWMLVAYRTPTNLDLVDALGAAQQTTLESLKQLEANSNYLLSIGFETISIEHFLNDLLDPYERRIFIETNEDYDPLYIFMDIESREDPIIYRAWDETIAYVTDDRIERKGKIYSAISGSTGVVPETHPSKWLFIEDAIHIDREDGYSPLFDFSVNLPDTHDPSASYDIGDLVMTEDALWVANENAITGAWDADKWNNYNEYIRKHLRKYIAVGKRYNIQMI